MKQVYVLTSKQAEELKDIKNRIISNVDIISNLIKKQQISDSIMDKLDEGFGRIIRYCWNMEDILTDE